MGIGRREFIKRLASGLVGMAAVRNDAVLLESDSYLNRRLGVSFRKPRGWTFLDTVEMGTIRDGMVLADEDPVSARDLVQSLDLPFVTVAPAVDNPQHFAPSAQFYLVENEPQLEQLFALGRELEEITAEFTGIPLNSNPPTIEKLEDDIDACRDHLREFRVQTTPREFQLSACAAAQYESTWLFEHQLQGSSMRVRTRTIYVRHRTVGYLIRLTDSPSAAAFNFDPLLASVCLS